jgi:hypothetical protein
MLGTRKFVIQEIPYLVMLHFTSSCNRLRRVVGKVETSPNDWRKIALRNDRKPQKPPQAG